MPTEPPESLIEMIEKQAHEKNINTSILVRKYEEAYNERPIFRLLQDLNQRVGVYQNLLEQIKKLDPEFDVAGIPSDKEQPIDTKATRLARKYEFLGLIPRSNLPQSKAKTICRYIMDKLSALGLAILDILAKHATKIADELRVSPEVTVVFQVGVGWSPKITIGIERSGSMVKVAGQPAVGVR